MPKFGTWRPRYYDTPNGKVPSVTTVCSVLEKRALVQWAANCAVDYITDSVANNTAILYNEARTAYKRISDKAKDTGTDIHELCAAWMEEVAESFTGETFEQIKSSTPKFDKEWDKADENTMAMFNSFFMWATKHHIKPIAIEQVVIGDGYGGRTDLVCEIDKFWDKEHKKDRVIALIDFKTGKGAYYPDWGLQTAAYRAAYNSNQTTGTAKHNGVLKFNKETLRANYKDFTRYTVITKGKKKIHTYENDLQAFKCLVKFWELQNG